MAGEYTKRRLFRLSHPDSNPVQCRVVLLPDQLNTMHAEQVAKYVIRKACKFFDIDSPKDIKIVDTRDLNDEDEERGNC